jgi:hypothetical protein
MRIPPLLTATTCLALLTATAAAQDKPKSTTPASTAPKSSTAKSAAPKSSSTAAKPPAAPVVSSEIRAGLARMAKAMNALTSFQVKADLTTEEVLTNGQKLQSSTELTADTRRPDRLFVSASSERRARRYYYDGKTLTVYGPRTHYYASVDAPPTTYQMLKAVSDKFGVDTPLLDLFEWGSGAVDLDKVTSAMYAGADRIGGHTCDQVAFRQPGVDWQLWISRNDPALPCKLVITSTDDPAQPQTTMILTWTTNSQFADDHFVFTPPPNAQRIVLGSIDVEKPGSTSKSAKVTSK